MSHNTNHNNFKKRQHSKQNNQRQNYPDQNPLNPIYNMVTPCYYSPYMMPNNVSCQKCDELKQEIKNLSTSMSLMQKNIALMSEQIKLMDAKLSIKKKSPIVSENINDLMFPSQNPLNQTPDPIIIHIDDLANVMKPDVFDKLNQKDKLKPKTSTDKIDMSLMEKILKDEHKNNINIKNEQMNPLAVLGSFFSMLDGLDKKKKEEDNKESETDEYDDVSEHESEEEFDELDIKIETIDDLIMLGKNWDKDKKYSVDLETLNKLIKPLTKLQKMIGLEKVKSSIVDMILYYLQGFESKNNNMLHTIIEGPPGVGKTQLGKILGEIYAGLGVIPSNKFKLVKRSDLVGEYLGHTAPKTQKVIDEADGGVLFIDEAYSLGNKDKRDSFSKECIDVINQNLSENKRKFICIIAGYPDELDKCFFSYNPGLKRRFPFKFSIDAYTAEELRDIFVLKVNNLKWKINYDLNNKALTSFFVQHNNIFTYFGGDIENLLVNCKFAHSKRVFGKHPKNKRKLSIADLELGFDKFKNHKHNKNDMPASIKHIYG